MGQTDSRNYERLRTTGKRDFTIGVYTDGNGRFGVPKAFVPRMRNDLYYEPILISTIEDLKSAIDVNLTVEAQKGLLKLLCPIAKPQDLIDHLRGVPSASLVDDAVTKRPFLNGGWLVYFPTEKAVP